MTHGSSTIGPVVFVAAMGALVAACERPSDRVTAPVPDTASRSAVAAPMPAAELPRASDAPAPASGPASVPSSEALSDAVITAKIKAAVLTDPGMSGSDVSVNTEHGVVVLAGSVKSHEQAGVASAHAQVQDGVMRVDNQLTLLVR